LNVTIEMFMTKLLARQVSPHHMLEPRPFGSNYIKWRGAQRSEQQLQLNYHYPCKFVIWLHLVACNYQLFTMLIRGGGSEHDGETIFGTIIGLQKFQAP
jgi:hypothetical protein